MFLRGDCLDVLPTLAADSIDAICTDPPYGLRFMGKDWDHGVPGVHFWQEALRVAKPGAHMVAFGGTRTYHRLTCAIEDAGWEIRDCLLWIFGTGYPKGRSCLKPSYEPIVLARKPLIGTVAQNVLTHGTGGLNIAGCRIAGMPATTRFNPATHGHEGWRMSATGAQTADTAKTAGGRWPANLILDEASAMALDAQTGSGGASRFFYVAKASTRERTAGLPEGHTNNHPTVKPLALMRWLVRLITPPGGLVLDPFAGSGTTGLACRDEGCEFTGIEVTPEYADIADQRLGITPEPPPAPVADLSCEDILDTLLLEVG